ncbi:MAG: hypothetical protein GX373_11400 [Gammaproteobacteria bacterium]|nr:hypothetical protein [Gammaproteobacteria bacterium]
MLFILLGLASSISGYYCLRHMSLLDMEQAAMLPFADDRPAARRVEEETGRPCLPEHLTQQSALKA